MNRIVLQVNSEYFYFNNNERRYLYEFNLVSYEIQNIIFLKLIHEVKP